MDAKSFITLGPELNLTEAGSSV